MNSELNPLQGTKEFIKNLWKYMIFKLLLFLFIFTILILGISLWKNLGEAKPVPVFPNIEDHYKYGVIGLGQQSRIPYWIWRVLPTIFPEKLLDPGNLASLGFIYESELPPGLPPGIPIGLAYRQVGYPSVEPNCALCHTGTIRKAADLKPQLLLGAPAHELDLQRFQQFLADCANDPRFTTSNLMAAIKDVHTMGPMESLTYKYFILPVAKKGLIKQAADYSWQSKRPAQGRGRVDTFNPTKFNVYHFPDDGTIGTTDLPQIWNQKERQDMYLHWDGNNNKLIQRNYAAAMAVGATPKSVLPDSFDRVTSFLESLGSPAYPFSIDQDKSNRGKSIFDGKCASCHAFTGEHVGQVTPVKLVGTDPHRLDSFTKELVDKFHQQGFEPWTKLDAYRKTDGYSNTPLDGIWARGPYLHNGSVPTLWDLLQPEDTRPKSFYRGYNVIDSTNVGFVSTGPDAEKVGFKFDVNIPGNGNQGHLYGVDLDINDKRDLIEYLKGI